MGTVFEINKLKFAIKEIPIIFRDREKGDSKISNSKKYFKITCTTTNNKTIFAINFKERRF